MPANNLSWMLWFEEDPKAALQASIAAASTYSRAKYGRVPNRLQAPLGRPENIPAEGLMVERKRFVLPRHLHLAIDLILVAENQGSITNPLSQGD